MARKKIIQKGDPILSKTSHPVTNFDSKLHTLLNDMKDTLRHIGGAGLAAVQIGILRRVVVVIDDQDEFVELVNPELVETSEEQQDGLEGCLSIAGMYGFVTRPMEATVRAQDRNGNFFTVSGKGIVARCFCHELEHLDGHLFDEHADRLYTEKQLDDLLENAEKDS